MVLGWDEEAQALTERRERTTVGRIVFNQILPDRLRYANHVMKRPDLKHLIDECYRNLGPEETAHLVDGIKSVGFEFATRGGLTIGLFDVQMPTNKKEELAKADSSVADIDKQFQRGLITEDERYEQVVGVWQDTTASMSDDMMKGLDPFGPLTMMTTSGARGNKGNLGQLGAMRGLMADPSGRIIDVPVRSNFREGMTVLEYFISTHGARKGLADTALRTADSGYLTRRLVDVAQDVITREDDCGTEEGSWITRAESADEADAFQRRLVGRLAAAPLPDPRVKVKKGETAPLIVDRNAEITEEMATAIDEAGIDEVLVRSPLTCEARYGVCRACYGRNLATGHDGRQRRGGRDHRRPVDRRARHAADDADVPHRWRRRPRHHRGPAARRGAVRGPDPEGQGRDQPHRRHRRDHPGDTGTKVKVISREGYDISLGPAGAPRCWRRAGDAVEANQVVARSRQGRQGHDRRGAPVKGFLVKGDNGLVVRAEDVVEREYAIPHNAKLLVENGQEIRAGDPITDGPINPQEYLDTRGKDAVQRYLVKEVQKVYRSQGVTINDKHIEIIVRQMLRKVRIDQPGDVDLLPTELIDRLEFEEANNRVLAEGGEPATAQTVLLGVTKASLNTSSFLAAASFQETTRVLTEAAINGAKDHLIGLKENVIIGKLIPAGTGAPANVAARKERERRAAIEALAGEAIEDTGSEYNPFLEEGRRAGLPTTRPPGWCSRRRSPGARKGRGRRGLRQPIPRARGGLGRRATSSIRPNPFLQDDPEEEGEPES